MKFYKTKNKQIILVPRGGLANRMRTIASGLVLALNCEREMSVIWIENEELNAPFNLIFKTDQLPFKITSPGNLVFNLCYEHPRKKNLYLSKIGSKIRGKKIINIDKEISSGRLISMIKDSGEEIIIHSGLQFHDIDHKFFKKIFQFSDEVIKTKAALLRNGTPDFSVQIRRTDNKQSIINSPIEIFEKYINDEIAKNEKVKFFLATDDEEIKKDLSQKYFSNIIFNSKKADRNTPEGICDASAEFLIMADCKRIYGSYWSSFSEMASLYGNNELIIVKK